MQLAWLECQRRLIDVLPRVPGASPWLHNEPLRVQVPTTHHVSEQQISLDTGKNRYTGTPCGVPIAEVHWHDRRLSMATALMPSTSPAALPRYQNQHLTALSTKILATVERWSFAKVSITSLLGFKLFATAMRFNCRFFGTTLTGHSENTTRACRWFYVCMVGGMVSETADIHRIPSAGVLIAC